MGASSGSCCQVAMHAADELVHEWTAERTGTKEAARGISPSHANRRPNHSMAAEPAPEPLTPSYARLLGSPSPQRAWLVAEQEAKRKVHKVSEKCNRTDVVRREEHGELQRDTHAAEGVAAERVDSVASDDYYDEWAELHIMLDDLDTILAGLVAASHEKEWRAFDHELDTPETQGTDFFSGAGDEASWGEAEVSAGMIATTWCEGDAEASEHAAHSEADGLQALEKEASVTESAVATCQAKSPLPVQGSWPMKDDKVASEDEDTMTWTDVPAAKREGQLPPSIEDSRPQELDAKITDDEAAEPGAGLAPSSGFAAAFVVARWADERGLAAAERPEEFYRYF
mmetsp:Transcript_29693/g.81304  ORF Transcript_29693/g.81304 Transcript_29693/m.81304 type:complete len:342 (-) Transcript_29693:67-1092(-)